MTSNRNHTLFRSAIAWLFIFSLAGAAEFHVSPTGNDTNSGAPTAMLRTISAAANLAQPGDTVTVHAGTYRERVNPPRGGTSDTNRITYQTAPGEPVVITGSEVVKNWERVTNDTWKATLPNKFFGASNPFDEQIYGSWYRSHGQPNHTGSVYLNGERLRESFSPDAVLKSVGGQPVWFAKADGNGGPVLMNFEWVRPAGGQPMSSMAASAENGDQAICIQFRSRWPFGYLKDGSILHFNGVDFGAGTDSLDIQAATLAKGGTVELHLGSLAGENLGSCWVTNTGDWERFAVFNLKLSRKLSGKQDLCFVLKAPPRDPNGSTIIWAQFPGGLNPNSAPVEIAARSAVFYPDKTGVNYITVCGFTLENAACNWAPPSAEQPGLIGPHWAKGWIIENNIIRNSRCSGISLGRPTFGHAHHYQKLQSKVYPETNGGQTEQQLVDYFENATWTKDEAGFHIIRNNHIYNCGQAGIVGCSGGAFSLIEGNDIHDICLGESFEGDEMAGIKLHFPVDTVIRNNHIYRCLRGVWLDWGAQGTLFERNLLHDNNNAQDIDIEVCHGPVLLANNLFLSQKAFGESSQGIALAHNLISGGVIACRPDGLSRDSYFYQPHDTVSAGKVGNPSGDWQIYNNLLAHVTISNVRNATLPVKLSGNVLVSGSTLASGPETYLMNIAAFKPSAGVSVSAASSAAKNGTQTQPCSEGGQNVGWIVDGSWLRYDNVDFGAGSESIAIRAAGAGAGGKIELRLDQADGELLGICNVTATGDWQKWQPFTAKIKPTAGKKNICLVFRPATGGEAGTGELVEPGFDAGLKLFQKADGWYLTVNEDNLWRDEAKCRLVTTELLGRAKIPNQAFTNPDGTPLAVDTDYFGNKRDGKNPFPGPFEISKGGTQTIKVWPIRQTTFAK
jgi:hypothetical protein